MLQYIEDVLVSPADSCLCQLGHLPAVLQADKVTPDARVGRMLTETLSRVPKFDEPKYEAMLNSAMQVSIAPPPKVRGVNLKRVVGFPQDLLMVVYLANLTKTQVVLGERLCQLPS